METLETAPPPRKKISPWIIVAAIVLAMLGVMTWLLLTDDPPPDDSDMVVTRSERGGKTNPLAIFLLEVKALHKRDERLSAEAQHLRETATDEIARFLETQKAAFEALDRLLATSSSTWQWITPDPDNTTVNAGRMIFLLRSKAHLDALRGEVHEAIDTQLKAIRFARGIQDAEGDLSAMIVSSSVPTFYPPWASPPPRHFALTQLLKADPVTPQLIRHCLNELSDREVISLSALKLGLQKSYRDAVSVTQHRANQEFWGKRSLPDAPQAVRDLLFKPHRTLSMMLHQRRELMRACDGGLSKVASALDTIKNRVSVDDWRTVWNPNRVGIEARRQDFRDLGGYIKRFLI